MHRRHEIHAIEAEPNLEAPGRLAYRDIGFGNDGAGKLALADEVHNLRVARPKPDDPHVLVRVEAVMADHFAHKPIAAAADRQHAQTLPDQGRPIVELRSRDEILHRTAAHAAADDLETGALADGGQPRRRPQFADFQSSGVVGGRNLGAAEYDSQGKVDPFFPKKPSLDAEPQLEAAFVGRDAVFERDCHGYSTASAACITSPSLYSPQTDFSTSNAKGSRS